MAGSRIKENSRRRRGGRVGGENILSFFLSIHLSFSFSFLPAINIYAFFFYVDIGNNPDYELLYFVFWFASGKHLSGISDMSRYDFACSLMSNTERLHCKVVPQNNYLLGLQV